MAINGHSAHKLTTLYPRDASNRMEFNRSIEKSVRNPEQREDEQIKRRNYTSAREILIKPLNIMCRWSK